MKAMDRQDWLARNFEETRPHLKGVAYRMLGSTDEADDAVQEAWLRLTRTESEKVENLKGWLTTVVARICLDMLRSRKSKSEEPLEENDSHIPTESPEEPAANIHLADSMGPALLVVLDALTPPERIAFVLHDLFDLSFEEIAPIIDRTEAATRQLASRARRKIRVARSTRDDPVRQNEVITAFLAASREGNFEALITLLHPDVLLRADESALKISEANKSKGAPQFKREIRGAKSIAELLNGTAKGAHLALINGLAGAVWPPTGKPVVAFCFSTAEGRISRIDVVMDRQTLDGLHIESME